MCSSLSEAPVSSTRKASTKVNLKSNTKSNHQLQASYREGKLKRNDESYYQETMKETKARIHLDLVGAGPFLQQKQPLPTLAMI